MYTKTCNECLEDFQTDDHRRMYCSKGCSHKAIGRQRAVENERRRAAKERYSSENLAVTAALRAWR